MYTHTQSPNIDISENLIQLDFIPFVNISGILYEEEKWFTSRRLQDTKTNKAVLLVVGCNK